MLEYVYKCIIFVLYTLVFVSYKKFHSNKVLGNYILTIQQYVTKYIVFKLKKTQLK